MRGQRHAPAALYPGKDPVPIVQEVGWAPGPVLTGAENLSSPQGFNPRTVQALRLCTGRTAHRGSRRITLLFLDHGTRSGEGSASRPGRSLP